MPERGRDKSQLLPPGEDSREAEQQGLRSEDDPVDLDLRLPDVPLWIDTQPDVKTLGEDGLPDPQPGREGSDHPDAASAWMEGQPPPAPLQKKLERPDPPQLDSSALEPPLIRPLMRPSPPALPVEPGGMRMGILGGKASGKSYLLQSLIYRTQATGQSGALSLYLRGGKVQVYRAESGQERLELISTQKLIQAYRSWTRLSFTQRDNQAWYRLALTFRRGLLGRSSSTLHIDFMDTSGEYREMSLTEDSHDEWRDAFLDVSVIAFCLPLWAAFPAAGLNPRDIEQRERFLQGFDAVVRNYRSLLEYEYRRPKVRCLLLLTMADDRRGDLVELTESWISPYLDDPEAYLHKLQRESGLSRYLANARRVSRTLRKAFASAPPSVARIPEILDFGQGAPWVVPVSAIEGATLDAVEQSALRPSAEPVPVHVELPLLLALCESHNVLM